MDAWALLTQVQSNIGVTCDRAIRQTSLIEARERSGLPAEHERNVLRGIRVSLGLEYHHEERLLALLTGESSIGESSTGGARDERRPAPSRRPCHRGTGADCPLPIRCCATLAAALPPCPPAIRVRTTLSPAALPKAALPQATLSQAALSHATRSDTAAAAAPH